MKRPFHDSGGEEFFTSSTLSEHRSLTPEGYLLIKDVPISRVGTFFYRPDECGIDAQSGVVGLSRNEAALFDPETIASFNGKPVVLGHEAGFADPANWKDRAVGVVANCRRGENDQAGCLLADLLITDQAAIDLVQSGELSEVSCGYDAETTQTGEGRGEQTGIIGNHVALVARARCGHQCRLGDGDLSIGEKAMVNLRAILRRAFADGDEESFNAAVRQVPAAPAAPAPAEKPVQDAPAPASTAPAPAAPAVTLEQVYKLLQAIDAKLPAVQQKTDEDTAPVPPADDDKPGDGSEGDDELNDEQTLPPEDAREVMDDCDVIAPGMKKPLGDSISKGMPYSVAVRLMRSALKASGVKRFGDADSMSAGEVAIAFKAAVDLARAGGMPRYTRHADAAPSNSIAAIQAKADAFWAKH